MEDVLQQEGWISCQNLLEETGEEERRNHLFERRVSYKKAVEQARKFFPEFCSTKNNNLDSQIQVGPKENVLILTEYSDSMHRFSFFTYAVYICARFGDLL